MLFSTFFFRFSTLAPPEILYTLEHTIRSEGDFGKSVKIGCSILSSPDTESRVVWSFQGEELSTESEKYNMIQLVKDPAENEVVEYNLLINDLQDSDIGPYTCHLHSEFHLEDTTETWIKHKENTC